MFLLINVKMPTIVGILTFMSRKNSILGLSEPKNVYSLILLYLWAFGISCSADLSMQKFYKLGAWSYQSTFCCCSVVHVSVIIYRVQVIFRGSILRDGWRHLKSLFTSWFCQNDKKVFHEYMHFNNDYFLYMMRRDKNMDIESDWMHFALYLTPFEKRGKKGKLA